MSRTYQVQLSADFTVKKESPEQIRESLIKIIKQEGFEDKNFIIGIEKVRKSSSKKSIILDLEVVKEKVAENDDKKKVTKQQKGNNNKLQRGGEGSNNIHIQRKVAKKA